MTTERTRVPGIRHRGNRFYARIYLGRDDTGKHVYVQRSFDRFKDAYEWRVRSRIERLRQSPSL